MGTIFTKQKNRPHRSQNQTYGSQRGNVVKHKLGDWN